MKNIRWLLVLMLGFSMALPARGQLGGLMNKVKNKIVDKALGVDSGSQDTGASGQDPDCATDDAVRVFEFDKGFKVARNEIRTWIYQGDILLLSKDTGKYFLKKKNSPSPEGPFGEEDPEVQRFLHVANSPEDAADFALLYPESVQKTGDGYTIRFGGKSYGPFASILSMVINDSGTQFAATISMDEPKMGNEMESIAKKIENAKTDQEKMQIAMQYQSQIIEETQKMSRIDVLPKLVTNVEGALMQVPSGSVLSSTVKYDGIVWVGMDKISDLAGNILFTWDVYQTQVENGNIWLSSDNKRYAVYSDGLLVINGTRKLNQLFSPFRSKSGTGEFLNYLYFSPVNNAIMQAMVPF